MSSLASRRRKLSKKIRAIKKESINLDKRTSRQMISFLRDLRSEIKTAIVAAEGFEVAFLPAIRDEITRSIRRFETRAGGLVGTGQDTAWDIGRRMIDDPLTSAEIRLALPMLSDTQLTVLKGFSADLVSGLTGDMLSRINNAVALNVVGERTIFETGKQIDNIIGIAKKKGMTDRANKIVRTEVGRAQSVATQARLEQAQKQVPELKKQWFTGINPRPTHAAADGQVREVNEPFDVGGYKAMEPRDPALPAKEVVRCNCGHGPYLEQLPA